MKTFKITFVLIALSVIGFTAKAQNTGGGISGGSILMGGTLGFSSSSATTTQKARGTETTLNTGNQWQFSLSPKMGYFFARNFCAGMSINFNSAGKTTNNRQVVADTLIIQQEGKTTDNQTQLLAGPFFRYYYFPSDRIAIFGELEFGFGVGSVSQDANGKVGPAASNSQTIAQINVGVGPGLAFFANDIVSIEALLKYNNLSSTSTYNTSSLGDVTQKTSINSVNFGVGFQFYFNRTIGGGM